ncbi:MAG: hypothetical protein Kow0069_08070 [Promethearchaeota archaeon]
MLVSLGKNHMGSREYAKVSVELKVARPLPQQRLKRARGNVPSHFKLVHSPEMVPALHSLGFPPAEFGFPTVYDMAFVDLPAPARAGGDIEFHLAAGLLSSSVAPFFSPEKQPREYFAALEPLLRCAYALVASDGVLAVKYQGRYRHYLKVMLDRIAGIDAFVNEILLHAPNYQTVSLAGGRKLEDASAIIFVYSKTERPKIFPMKKLKKSGGYWHTMHSKGQGGPKVFRIGGREHMIAPPVGNHWKFKQETIDRMCAEGKIKLNSRGKPVYWVPPEEGHDLDNIWLDVKGLTRTALGWEITPEVHERLVGSFVPPGGWVLHVFAGSGRYFNLKTAKRWRWVLLDPRPRALAYLEALPSCESFAIGWYHVPAPSKHGVEEFRRLVLQLLNAQPVSGMKIFNGMVPCGTLVYVSPWNTTFDAHQLEMCLEEFLALKKRFRNVLVTSRQFRVDDAWNRIVEKKKAVIKKFTFLEYGEFWKQLSLPGRWLETPKVNASANRILGGIEVVLNDVFVLNNPDGDISGVNYKEKGWSLSHVTVALIDGSGKIIRRKITRKSRIFFPDEDHLLERVVCIELKVSDAWGASALRELKLN